MENVRVLSCRVDEDQRCNDGVAMLIAWLRIERVASRRDAIAYLLTAGLTEEEADAVVRRGLSTGQLVRVAITRLLRAR